MKVDIFDFDLDKDLIAKKPADPRDSSRLLDLSDENSMHDRHFFDLPAVIAVSVWETVPQPVNTAL